MNLENQFGDSLWRPMTQHAAPPPASKKRFVEAKGCYLYDEKGRPVLDAAAGLFCVNVGYGRPELVKAAAETMEQLAYLAPTFANAPAVELADLIAELIGQPGYVYFSSSGSEANETAFKIARQYHAQSSGRAGRYKIIARYRSYHGNTFGALAATGQSLRKTGYEPLATGFLHVMPPYAYRASADVTSDQDGELAARQLEDMILHEGPESVAAVIIEPLISGGGVLVPPDNYLPAVREICDRYGVLLIFDEVVSGFGRTGAMFGFAHWSVQPDICTFAKGLSSGYFPIGATFARKEIADAFLGVGASEYFRQVNTFGGHPVGSAVALANLRIVLAEELAERAASQGKWIQQALEARIGNHPNVGEIRGKGLLIGIEMVGDRSSKAPIDDKAMGKIISGALDEGVLIARNGTTIPGRTNVLILAPPLVISRKEAQSIVDLLANQVDQL